MNKPAILIPRIDFHDCHDSGTITARLDAEGRTLLVDEVPWKEMYPYRPLVVVSLAHDDRYIYASFIIRSRTIKGLYLNDQEAVCDDSCVEIFLKPQAEGEYWNIEFNCLGTLNSSRRLSRTISTHLTPEDSATILRFPSMPRESFDERPTNSTWELLVMIPLELIGLGNTEFPKAIRGNIYACASGMKDPYYLSYFPVATPKPDYHRPETFGSIVLE